MRRKPKTEARQRNNRSLNTVDIPASIHPAGHLLDQQSLLFTARVRVCRCDCVPETGQQD
jgi:hypothetical protein